MFKIDKEKLPTKGDTRIYLEEFLGEVTVMAEDEDGYDWYICTLKEGKPMKLHAALPRDFEMPVDEDGYIETYKEA